MGSRCSFSLHDQGKPPDVSGWTRPGVLPWHRYFSAPKRHFCRTSLGMDDGGDRRLPQHILNWRVQRSARQIGAYFGAVGILASRRSRLARCRTRLWNGVRFLCDRCVSIGSHPRTKACPRCMRGMALASNRGCQARREVRGARGLGPHDRSELRELASQIHAQPANTLKQPTGSERGGPRPSGRPTCQPGNQHLHSPRQLPAAQSQRDGPRDRLSWLITPGRPGSPVLWGPHGIQTAQPPTP